MAEGGNNSGGGFVRARRLLFVLSLSRRLSLLSGASHSADSPATPYSADSPAPPHSTDSPTPTGGAPSPAEASESRLVKLVARAFYDDFTTKGENQPKSRRSDNHGIVRRVPLPSPVLIFLATVQILLWTFLQVTSSTGSLSRLSRISLPLRTSRERLERISSFASSFINDLQDRVL
ncbi:hypothetical protein EUGRSUZ_B01773 [Eucalyptus grandis]|uniref:Uncharacterized protein n=2 Tax=Eucalyptus grandis TaxID=71139 RepID=A0ACC3LS70_EUCGR|nr:hypothetical protein EUGRSUZ_B01773 [Eucalyptus grandis]